MIPFLPAPDEASTPSPLFELVGGLSKAMDLISPQVVDHHSRVAYIAARVGEILGLEPRVLAEVIFAALTHDIGAFSFRTRLDTLDFESDQVAHAEVGWRLLNQFPDFKRIAAMVRHHHVRAEHAPDIDGPADVVDASMLIHLADRAEVSLRRRECTLTPDELVQSVAPHAGTWFIERHVEALRELAGAPNFFADLACADQLAYLKAKAAPLDKFLSVDDITVFSQLFSQIIDFRSRFTATHSRGVAATAGELMGLFSDDDNARRLMVVAGNLHDLGKLAVPKSILEKPAALTDGEYAIMQNHATLTHTILSSIPGLINIAAWAGNHHERLDGRGYPRSLGTDSLDMGSRVMAVADVFTALTEDRPYRSGMGRAKVLAILREQAAKGVLDAGAVNMLASHFDDLNAVRIEAQGRALADFKSFAAAV